MLNGICPGMWAAEHDVKMPGGVIFRTRMTVVDLGEGKLLLHSPVPLDDTLASRIDQLGEVRWIVAPNDHHHLFVGQAAARFPQAEVFGSGGAREHEPQVTFSGGLEAGAPQAWSGHIEMLHIEGTKRWNEFVFFVPASKTLLCSDLVFNIHDIPNLATHLMLLVVGAKRRLVQSRTLRWLMVADRARYAESISKVLDWDFDRVVMGHGRVVDSGGHRQMVEAVRWALPEPRNQRLTT